MVGHWARSVNRDEGRCGLDAVGYNAAQAPRHGRRGEPVRRARAAPTPTRHDPQPGGCERAQMTGSFKKLRPYDEPPKRRRSLIPGAPDSAAGLWFAFA